MKIDDGRCIYVLYNPTTKLTKIGVSDNIESRKSQLEAACGCPLQFVYKSKHLLCGEKYEADVHNRLKQQRKLGEWFDISNPTDAIDVIDEIVLTATEDPIIENYRKGMSITKLAEEMEVTRQAILARLKKYGVYDNKGRIYERDPRTVRVTIPNIPTVKENKALHISDVPDVDDDIMFLDGEEPTLPLKGLKRVEPNINFNGEWYQIALFRKGEFIYSYTRDITKARAYVQGVRTMAFITNTNI